MNAKVQKAETAATPDAEVVTLTTGYAAEYAGRRAMRNVPRNINPDARYKVVKAYKPRVPECEAAWAASLAVLGPDGTATGWELHKAC